MLIAVLCAGPSLPRTWSGRHRSDGTTVDFPRGRTFDQVLAVNRAGEFACDWWHAQDVETFNSYHHRVLPRVGICTWGHLWENYNLGRYALPPGLKWLSPDALPDAGFRYLSLTMMGALAHAVLLGAKEVDVYGADWSGQADFAGGTLPDPESRGEARWKSEREIYERLTAAFKHVTFTRILPEAAHGS